MNQRCCSVPVPAVPKIARYTRLSNGVVTPYKHDLDTSRRNALILLNISDIIPHVSEVSYRENQFVLIGKETVQDDL